MQSPRILVQVTIRKYPRQQVEIEFKDKPVVIASKVAFRDNNAVLDFTQGPDIAR